MSPELQSAAAFSGHEEEEEERLLSSYAYGEEKKSTKIQVGITGMTCAACSSSVQSALIALTGVSKVSVALLQNRADVSYDPAHLTNEDIVNTIEEAGFEAEILPDPITSGTSIGHFTIGGMTCAACVNSVQGILRKLPGVKKAEVALATSLAEVEYDPNITGKNGIISAIEDAGFEASFIKSNEHDKLLLGVPGVVNETDVKWLEGILCSVKGVRKFYLEIHFDPELLGSRAIVDEIENGSFGKIKPLVRNPLTRMTYKDVEGSSNMHVSALHH